MKANFKKARAAFVEAIVESIVTKAFIREVAASVNEALEQEAVDEVLYGGGRKVSLATVFKVIDDEIFSFFIAELDMRYDYRELADDVEQRVERALKRALKISGTRIVNVAVGKNGKNAKVVK